MKCSLFGISMEITWDPPLVHMVKDVHVLGKMSWKNYWMIWIVMKMKRGLMRIGIYRS